MRRAGRASTASAGVALRTNVALAAILGLLIVVAIGSSALRRAWEPGDPIEEKLFGEDFTGGRAMRVEIRRGADEVLLERLADDPASEWKVSSAGGYPANRLQIARALQKLVRWDRGLVVGGAAEHAEYLVTEEAGTRVTVRAADGSLLADVIVGKLAGIDAEAARQRGGQLDPKDFAIYIRRADEDAIYLFRDFVLGIFQAEIAPFLASPLVIFDPDSLVRLRAERAEGGGIDVARPGPREPWALADDPRPLDPGAVALLASAVSRLTPLAVIGRDLPGGRHGLEEPSATIELAGTRGLKPVTVVIRVGDRLAEDPERVAVQVEGTPFVVALAGAAIDALLVDPEGLVVRQLAAFAPGGVRRVRLRFVAEDGAPPSIVTVHEKAGRWLVDGDADREIGRDVMTGLLAALTNLRIEEFRPPDEPVAAAGLDAPLIAWEVLTESGELDGARVGGPVPDAAPATRFAQRREGRVVVTVAEEAVASILETVRGLSGASGEPSGGS